ncbi:MAG: glutamate synthase subunit beta [Bryobacterales bacterium]
MGKVTGFMEYTRQAPKGRPVAERIKDWNEVYEKTAEAALKTQGARCMDCGIPFCHTGCPLTNIIPDWNDLVYRGRWKEALRELHSTNNFPEFTGRICPAPCESACVLGINDDPVAIKSIEKAIADRGWAEGWIVPEPPQTRSGKKVAVIGSGPAGLAAAQQLNRAGHMVTVFEKNEVPGGLMVLGIPDFKMEKSHVERRVHQMEQEGVEFRTGVHVGVNLEAKKLVGDFDAVLIATGSEKPRDLPIPGRDLEGIHFAMQFLPQQNRRIGNRPVDPAFDLTAKDQHVVIIGGGDTGADCLGTSRRQGAREIHQFELLPKPPLSREEPGAQPWPLWPFTFKAESSHEEGDVRDWAVATKEFIGDADGHVRKLRAVRLEWKPVDPSGRRAGFEEIAGSEFEIPADLVLLAMGFVHPVHEGLVTELGVEKDERGNVKADFKTFNTSIDKVFVAGDARRGQSLVVWALAEGRKAARAIDLYLMGKSHLPES